MRIHLIELNHIKKIKYSFNSFLSITFNEKKISLISVVNLEFKTKVAKKNGIIKNFK